MEHLQTEISRAAACEHLGRFDFKYPDGADPHEVTVRHARCWMLDTPHGRILYCCEMFEGAMWVTAAAGVTSAPAVGHLARALKKRAAEMGARDICFYTARRGLVKVARRFGYEVARALPSGWEMKKVT